MKIFEPLKIKNVTFKNRIAMAAVTRYGYTADYGMMDIRQTEEYLNLADKEIGLIFSPSLTIDENPETMQSPGVYSKEHVGYLKMLADAYHKEGTRFFVQLSLHGYSIYDAESIQAMNALSIDELVKIKEKYVRAAKLCLEAGADGIEIHGAHGFFLNLMTSSITNQRKDCYGGNLQGRLAFVREIISSVREVVGNEVLISYRMGWTTDFDEDVQMAQSLESMGIDILNVSSGIPGDRAIALPENYKYSSVTYVGSFLKHKVNIPVMIVDNIATLERGNQLLEEGAGDFVAYARPFLVDSSFIVNSRDNANYKPCLGCKTCQWLTNTSMCPVIRTKEKIKHEN